MPIEGQEVFLSTAVAPVMRNRLYEISFDLALRSGRIIFNVEDPSTGKLLRQYWRTERQDLLPEKFVVESSEATELQLRVITDHTKATGMDMSVGFVRVQEVYLNDRYK